MSYQGAGRVLRKVRVQTASECIAGLLAIGEQVRTLDDINLGATRFLLLHEPRAEKGAWQLEPGPVAINTAEIVYISESDPPGAFAVNRLAASRKSRSRVRLRTAEYTIDGFVHIPANGKALVRLRQEHRLFIALTEAKVLGPDVAFEAPFLAVNRDHVLAAQELPQPAAEAPALEEETAAASRNV